MPTDIRRTGRLQRHARVRDRVSGGPQRPRLAVFRSLSHIYAQVIDDASGRTLAAASDLDVKAGKKSERAKGVGRAVAERAKAAGINEVVFDRGGYRYHGRVKALADSARETGLRF
ncbi:MAG: 50S ribosomal protein L18 [Chloroflexota bacterium]|nr:50S ribosomal protein L18 [Chloroflexota bacterium]MDE3103136.1 50S ribosomal protein L18 [Chloroflexota bacterium]